MGVVCSLLPSQVIGRHRRPLTRLLLAILPLTQQIPPAPLIHHILGAESSGCQFAMTSAGKTLTITYTGIAPLVAEDSQFEFKSRGAEAGTLTSITDTLADPDANYFVVEKKKKKKRKKKKREK